MNRRAFIAGLGSVAWPLAARAQQPLPVVGLINGGTSEASARYIAAFRTGLRESGYVEGENVSVEYHWLEGRFDRASGLIDDLVRRRVAAIATPASIVAARAAQAATQTIPIVFAVNVDPVRLGLVSSLPRPGGNATGVNFFSNEAFPKRLGLLHELLPNAKPIAVLINPSNNGNAEVTLREVKDAANLIGLPIEFHEAKNAREIEVAFAAMARERIEALFVAPDAYFLARRVQLVTLATRHGIATSFSNRDFPEVGGLMSYGADLGEAWRQVGAYTGRILKGAKPADLPVVQSTKFQFVINLQTARALGIEAPPGILARADEVIE